MPQNKSDAVNQGGRPKNVNERQLQDAIEPLLARIAGLENPASGDGSQACSRGHFFMHLLTGMCIHRGEAAFNPQFLDTVRNNADDFYEAYRQIVAGTHEVQSTSRQLLDEAQARIRAIEQEKQDLRKRANELEQETSALRAASAEEEVHVE